MIHLTKERYAELLRAEYMLESLENWGVDNWLGYDGAIHESIDDMPSAWDFCHMSDDEVVNYWEERD